jgi:hypothetical protein
MRKHAEQYTHMVSGGTQSRRCRGGGAGPDVLEACVAVYVVIVMCLSADLLLQSVTTQAQHLQPVQQGCRDVGCTVGGRHKCDGAEVVGQAKVGISEGTVLLRVEDLQQC